MSYRLERRALLHISVTVFAVNILFGVVAGKSATKTMVDGPELIQIVENQSASWNRGDIGEFMEPYWHDERLTFSSGGKTKRGWQATFENYKKNYPDRETMGKLTFTEMETQELGPDAILMLGNWHLERAIPVGGNFSLVWKRIDGKWLIVHDHSSSAVKP